MSWYFFGGFSAYLMVPSGPEDEPIGMLLDPRVVRRALDGEVERHFHALRVAGADEAAEVGERAELGMHRLVSALDRADCIRTAGVVRARR